MLTLLLGLLVSIKIASLDAERRIANERSQAVMELAALRARLEGTVQATFSAIEGLVHVISYQGDISAELFNALAEQSIRKHPVIRNLALAPNDTIRLVWPVAGNERVIGMRYATRPEQYKTVLQAHQKRAPVLSGPFKLVQGGEGVILRAPIFTGRASHQTSDGYWGVVSIVAHLDKLLDGAGFPRSRHLLIGLRGKDGLGGAGAWIVGTDAQFADNPITMDVEIPGGTWQLVAVHKGGWPSALIDSPYLPLGLVNSLLLAIFVGLLVYRQREMAAKNRELSREINDRIRSEENLQLSERKYASIFNLMPDMVGITRTVDGRFIEVNNGFVECTGWSREEVVGRSSLDLGLWDPETRERALEILRAHGRVENFDFTLTIKSGAKRHAVMFLIPIRVQDNDCLYFIARDVNELKEAEQALRAERDFSTGIIEGTPAVICGIDSDGTTTFINPAGEAITGYRREELIGKNWWDIFYPGAEYRQVEQLLAAFAAGENVRDYEMRLTAKDGTVRTISWNSINLCDESGAILEIVGFGNDITERKQAESERLELERRLLHTQKLESIGVLAGGIAHDFNNLLTGLYGFLEIIRMKNTDPVIATYLERVFSAYSRAKDLTHRLLIFAKGGSPNRKPCPVGHLLRQSVSFALSGSTAWCDYRIADNLWWCNIDENQIGQVIENLVINAKQAMPDGGQIVIAAENTTLPKEGLPALPPGRYVKITLQDTGTGIPEDILPHIFDPFFTTKQYGSGLGLATCHSIMQQHDGSIEAASTPGSGSTFTLLLPAVDRAESPAAGAANVMASGKGRILVMDDEESVREVEEEMLEMLGYGVITATDGIEALQMLKVCATKGVPLAAVVLDLTVPGGVGGGAIIEELRALYPDITVIAASGYAADPIMAHPEEYGFTDRLQKPFQLKDLAEILDRYLGTAEPETR